jgi:hypothetical protein
MKCRILTVLVFASTIGMAARPQGAGLGLMGGDPSGISFKLYTSWRTAVDAGLGYSYFHYGRAPSAHVDVLWHSHSMISEDYGYLPFYVGVGGRLKLADSEHGYPDTRLGVRIPFGVEYVLTVVPVGLFFEVVPVFNVMPLGDWLDYNSSIGFRYYFGGPGSD